MQLLQALNLLNETCAIRHYSLKTQKSYSHWLRRYSAFLKDPKFKLLSPEEKLEAFLTRLALSGISASSQNQAFNALLFFYRDVLNLQLGPVDSLRAHRPASLRYCPDRAEVFQLLAAVTNVGGYPTRLIVHLLYACGLRVCEPLNLRIKDIDLKQRRLYLYQSKGGKGRVVLFPECLAQPLERQLALAKAQAELDRADNLPVALPGLLAKKYPYAARSERWAWLFPARGICRDPRSKTLVRWRCHESNVQRAVHLATLRAHLEALTPHCLRHAFATHSLQGGTLVRDLQVVLGHNSLETTMLYLHAEADRVTSPLQDYIGEPVPAAAPANRLQTAPLQSAYERRCPARSSAPVLTNATLSPGHPPRAISPRPVAG